ncbi:MAG TPA: hypothetical protein VMB50_14340 [Myxococcales bacterium]|nr:hypothetical protein [Myxococcales bacterium]
MPRSVIEHVGDFALRLTYDDRGRLVGAVHGAMRLELSPDVPSGRRSGVDGNEEWRDGKVKGSWADLPYGHDCDVDESVPYDDWVERGLRGFREQVFFACCPAGRQPPPELAAETVRYAIEHDVLSRHSIHPAAVATTRLAARAASPRDLRDWRSHFERKGLEAYVAALAEGLTAS